MRKLILLFAAFGLLAGCTTPSTVLVNSQGKMGRCATTGYGYGIMGAIAISAANSAYESCVRDAKRIGFVEIPEASLGVESRWADSPLKLTVIRRNSPAERAGIKADDIVRAVDNEPISDFFSLLRFLNTKRPGDKVTVTIDRLGKILQLPVTLGDRDEVIK